MQKKKKIGLEFQSIPISATMYRTCGDEAAQRSHEVTCRGLG